MSPLARKSTLDVTTYISSIHTAAHKITEIPGLLPQLHVYNH
jgi:hypothetical protein